VERLEAIGCSVSLMKNSGAMMDRRDFVTFDAEFPDDAQWDEQGNALVPGGRAVAEAIKDKLQERAVSCSDVAQHSFYGWAFDVKSENSRVWCLLQTGDAWLLLLEERKSLMKRFFGSSNTAGFDSLQMKIHDILTGDRRFSNILWYTKSDYESGKKERAHRSPR
jgi:hypothetical protein